MTTLTIRFLAHLFGLLLFGATVAHAQLSAPKGNAISSRLIAETDTPAAGETLTLALVMKPKPGWHGYWKNPGDAGVEPRVEWQLPPGVEAGQMLFPVPGKLIISGLMNYVYEGEYAQLIPLRISKLLAPGTPLNLRGTAHYLACTDEICVPETAPVALDLVVGDKGGFPGRAAAFDNYRQALPKPLGSVARFEKSGGRMRIAIALPGTLAISDPYVFPLTDGALLYSAPQNITRNGDWLIVETEAGKLSLDRLEGVLKIGERNGLSFVARPGAVPAAGTALDPARTNANRKAQGGGYTILIALAGAILGGLFLNIMPCVFPILSLKALSLATLGRDEAAARREALAYTAGIVLTCVALGALLLLLRSGGAAIGWAFQLQDPRVILFLLLLVSVIALNLIGLFELPAFAGGNRLAGAGGSSGAFWTGALAAFVATPCTGPFMGAALGAALILPSAAALAIFAGLGLGLALPFLLLGFIPALRRLLPRPGRWMSIFRRILSLPMFATAIGLAWILERQSGMEGLAIGLATALAVGAALWWAWKRQALLPLAPAALAIIASILLVPVAHSPAASQSVGPLAAEPFSEERLDALRSGGRPVFVYFTADWCLTCKVNEKAVLAREEVADAFASRRVAVLAGDWTGGDASIGRFLEKNGRSGVPFYLYYPPGKPAEILPQILTVGRLKALAAPA